MKFRFIHQEKRWFGVDAMCRALGVTRSGYWAWTRRLPGPREKANSKLLSEILKIHTGKRKVYGSPRIHEHLQKKGVSCGQNRVARLMRENGIKAKQAKKFKPVTTDSKHNQPVASNVLDRRFHWDAPNKAWVTDLTCVPTSEG